MQSCTECGTPITPAIGPPVLNNGNVVCQPCWQKIGADAAPKPRPAVTSRRSVSSTAPASSRRQTSATPASRRSTSTREEAPTPARSSRSTSRSGTPSSEPAPPRATSRTAALIEQVESSTTGDRMKLYIIIAMCVMIIIAAVVGFMWKSKMERDALAEKVATEASDAALADVKRVVLQEPDNFDKQLEAIKAAEGKMEGFPGKRSELSGIQSDVSVKRDAYNTKKEATDLLNELKKDVEDPAKLESVRLKIDRANKFGSSQGKEYLLAIKDVETKLTLNTLRKSVDAAKAKEAQGNAFEALSAYDESVIQFNKYIDKQGGTAEKPVIDLYKELLAESDKLVERTETPEYEASVVERDMLSTKERSLWGSSEGAKNTFAGRELKLEGIDSGKKIMGVVSMLPPRSTPWNDIVMDLEFTILSEGFQMYLRFEQTKKYYTIGFKPADGYELNKPYRMTIRVKGSTVTLKQADQPENRDKLDASVSRTGGIGFGFNKGASAVISVCKIKVLRPKS